MKLDREFAWTLLIQGTGGGSMLLAALWLGWALGPEQQGQFNQIKSYVDLGIALATLGLPQALYVYAQSGHLSIARAKSMVLGMSAFAMAAGLFVGFWHMKAPPLLLLVFALTITAGSLHAHWRTLVLLHAHTIYFNLVTIAPQLLLLPLALSLILTGPSSAFTVTSAMFLAWGTATFFARWALKKIPNEPCAGQQQVRLHQLLTHGFSTGISAILFISATVLLQKMAQHSAGSAGLGLISLALLLAQAPLTPINYALPLLLRNRLQLPDAHKFSRRAFAISMLLMLLLSLSVLLIGKIRSDLWLGLGYVGLAALVAALLVANVAEVALRFGGVEAQAQLTPWHMAVAEATRLSSLIAFWLHTNLDSPPPELVDLALAWLFSSLMAVFAMSACKAFSQHRQKNNTPFESSAP